MEVGLLGRKEPKLPRHTPPTQPVWGWAFMEGLTWKIMIIFEDMLACVQNISCFLLNWPKKTSHSTLKRMLVILKQLNSNSHEKNPFHFSGKTNVTNLNNRCGGHSWSSWAHLVILKVNITNLNTLLYWKQILPTLTACYIESKYYLILNSRC